MNSETSLHSDTSITFTNNDEENSNSSKVEKRTSTLKFLLSSSNLEDGDEEDS
eukprot:Pgem_evm1s6821